MFMKTIVHKIYLHWIVGYLNTCSGITSQINRHTCAKKFKTSYFGDYFQSITDYSLPLAMRQLKGKVKENRKEKRERKMENKRNHDNVLKICLPVFGVIIAIIVAYVYVSTRPKG